MQSSFGWCRLFYGRNRDLGKARAWLERAKSFGCNTVRLFDEAHNHDGHNFFEKINAKPWKLNQPTNSRFSMTREHKRAHIEQTKLLVETGMVAERVINATIKEMPGPLQGHVERTAHFWERMNRTVMQFAHEEGLTNTYYENVNEMNAHVPQALYQYMFNDVNGVDLINNAMPQRAGRDYPGVPYGISNGGGWEHDYKNYTVCNIHSPRGGNRWHQVFEPVQRLVRKFEIPVILNENMHGMSREQWYRWVTERRWPNAEKLAAQSRPDTDQEVERMVTQMKEAFRAGAAGYCLHNMNGMLSDPNLDYDGFEIAFGEAYQSPVDPGNPPHPEPPEPGNKILRAYRPIINQAYKDILRRPVDPEGLKDYVNYLHGGGSEAEMRNALMRSEEFWDKFLA